MIATQHRNFVHHAALDPSGTLLATCSSDKTVEVYYRVLRHASDGYDNNSSSSDDAVVVEGDGAAAAASTSSSSPLATNLSWTRGCVIRDHSGPVVRLAWCQQLEHGPLLATAGADQWLYLYRVTVATLAGAQTVVQAERWTTHRGFEKDAITGVAFVPPQQHHLLLLSTASLDGLVRLYEVRRQSQIVFFARVIPEEQCDTHIFTAAAAATGAATGAVAVAHAAGSSSSNNSSSSAAVPPPSSSSSAKVHYGTNEACTLPVSSAATALTTSAATATAPASRRSGITAIAWFAGAAETGMTLAAGTVAGRCLLFRFRTDSNTFCPIALPHTLQRRLVCDAPVEDVKWAPSLGRRFQLLAVCSRGVVLILRVHCISPSNVEGGATMRDADAQCADDDDKDDGDDDMYELYHHPHGAVSAEWSRSGTLLYLVSDDAQRRFAVLQMRNPLDHQSWHVVARDAVGGA